jgi:epoxyqueuosine reductase
LVFNIIHEALKPVGYQVKTVSITRLPELQESVAALIREGVINKRLSDNWHFYRTPNTELPEAKTIIIAALPQSITLVTFSLQGRDYPAEIAPAEYSLADELQIEETLKQALKSAGYKVIKARLPLKTLAVRSGLARYGKNNIAYVREMGSFCRLIAFYTDAPCEEDTWQAPGVMKACDNCTLCRDSCPNGSITGDRFLIHAENCLGFLQEIKPECPYWVQYQPDRPNAFIGCMRCQSVCPANKPYLKSIETGSSFSEEETALILNKTPWEQLSLETREKLEGIPGLYPLIACNLFALMEKQRQAG